MKFLHTSDWHIGRSLYGRKRYEEFEAFLNWLAGFISDQKIDVLLVAGDVFDTGTPGNLAQELYYRFLCRVAASCCRHVVVISGNHDSPSFLNAPRMVLRTLSIHVVGSATDDPADEVLILKSASGHPEAIVCAVPFLRDRDIRQPEPGESIEDKTEKLLMGLKRHYADVGRAAADFKKKCRDIPVIGMGHLFAAGGRTTEDDGVRQLYVGSLARAGTDIFPACMDYVALGHLHIPQTVGKKNHIRYSGSPIPMGFGEARQEKKVVEIFFDGRTPDIREHGVPCFQRLERLSGSLDEILLRISELASEKSTAWLEIEYTGTRVVGNLRQKIEDAVAATGLEIRRIKDGHAVERMMSRHTASETLEDLDEDQVFQRLLDAWDVPENDRTSLKAAYREILVSLRQKDVNAE